jgi:Flp pilus assembly protein TadD
LQDDAKYRDASPYRDEAQALLKLNDVKADYEKTASDQYLVRCAFFYFNDGAQAYNDKNLKDASDLMKYTVKIHNLGGGKRFEKYPNKQFDTIAAEARLTRGNCAYYTGKYEDAISFLDESKTNPVTRSAAVYECLIDAYNKVNDSTQMLTAIREARKAYPDDAIIRNYELKYYMNYGKKEDMLRKMEEASSKDPGNAELWYNLGTTYYIMGDPKSGKKPANSTELMGKAEDAYKKAAKADPDNAEFNFNLAVLYFNQGSDNNDFMAAITGNTETDLKKFEELKGVRDGYYTKAQPWFEAAYKILAAKEANLKGENKSIYRSTVYSLWQIYSTQNKTEKAKELKTKYDSLGQ